MAWWLHESDHHCPPLGDVEQLSPFPEFYDRLVVTVSEGKFFW
jgi:hypothetical protein